MPTLVANHGTFGKNAYAVDFLYWTKPNTFVQWPKQKAAFRVPGFSSVYYCFWRKMQILFFLMKWCLSIKRKRESFCAGTRLKHRTQWFLLPPHTQGKGAPEIENPKERPNYPCKLSALLYWTKQSFFFLWMRRGKRDLHINRFKP